MTVRRSSIGAKGLPGTNAPKRPDSSLDLLVEDIAGLNLRGLRTISDMFVRPKTVFAAARDADWDRNYTPSIRLVFSFLVLMTVLRFFWADDTGVFGALFAENLRNIGYDETRAAQETRRVFNAFLGVFPITVILLHLTMAWSLRIWGPGTPAVMRIRYYFLTIVPSIVISTLSLLCVPALTPSVLVVWSIAIVLIAMMFDATTFWRSVTIKRSGGQIAWRALLLAYASTTVTLFGSTLTFIGVQLFFLVL